MSFSLPDAVADLFRTVLPSRYEVLDQWTRTLADLPGEPMGLEVDEASWVGTVFEVLVGLDVAEVVPYPEVLEYLPTEACITLLRGLGYEMHARGDVESWRRVARPQLPLDAAQRDALAATRAVQPAREWHRLHPETPTAERRSWISERGWNPSPLDGPKLRGLTRLWETYLEFGRAALEPLGKLVDVDVTVSQHQRTADLIVGTTLIDVKAVSEPRSNTFDPDDRFRQWLDQILFYALADVDDRYGLDRIAVYLGWQGGLLEASLHELAARDDQTTQGLREQMLRIAPGWR